MSVEDDISALQLQVSELQGLISGLQSSISNINTSLGVKAPISNPNFTSTVKINSESVATTTYVDDKIDEISGANTIPLSPAEISGGYYNSNGEYVDYFSTGNVGTEIPYARADHRHPGDVTRAPIENPVFGGIPRSDYTPLEGDSEYNGNCLANTRFVIEAVKKYTTPQVVITPPAEEGQLPQAEKTDQPGGNSENTDIGGGGVGGKGGEGGGNSGTSVNEGHDGDDGTPGGNGSYSLKQTAYSDNYNWDIATYVHTPPA
jgi:hypothetical protein